MTDAICLTASDIDALLDRIALIDAIEAVRAGYRQRGEGAPAKPRTRLTPKDGPWGMLTSYMAILPDTGAMGGYMYDVGFSSKDAWLSASLWDAASGEFLAHLDGNAWNPLKTGATGAIGIDMLARESATTLGIIGSGTQARAQLRAAVEVRDIEDVKVYSPTPESRGSFAESMQDEFSVTVQPVNSSRGAARAADIIVTATKAGDPVVEYTDISPGTHITAMGQYHPERRELDRETISNATYVPDLRARALQDAGSFLHALRAGDITEDHIHAELGDIVAGTKQGRTTANEITIFDSGGTGIETVAVAHLLYEAALTQELGTPITVSSSSELAQNT